jgi:hypothetical protein
VGQLVAFLTMRGITRAYEVTSEHVEELMVTLLERWAPATPGGWVRGRFVPLEGGVKVVSTQRAEI